VKACPFVEDVQVFKNHSGVVKIEVKQVKPLARIYYNGINDKYLLPNGKLIAVSPKYTSRTLIVRGDYTYKFADTAFVDSPDWNAYVEFFKRVGSDKHWNAQISELKIQKDGTIIIFPQIGEYEIKFGTPDDLEIKLKKLNIFFKEILPLRGWDAYQAVNVQYKDQIICD
jgi:cell division protein FtsQ